MKRCGKVSKRQEKEFLKRGTWLGQTTERRWSVAKEKGRCLFSTVLLLIAGCFYLKLINLKALLVTSFSNRGEELPAAVVSGHQFQLWSLLWVL